MFHIHPYCVNDDFIYSHCLGRAGRGMATKSNLKYRQILEGKATLSSVLKNGFTDLRSNLCRDFNNPDHRSAADV